MHVDSEVASVIQIVSYEPQGYRLAVCEIIITEFFLLYFIDLHNIQRTRESIKPVLFSLGGKCILNEIGARSCLCFLKIKSLARSCIIDIYGNDDVCTSRSY